MSIFSNLASSTPAEIVTYTDGLLDLLGKADPVEVLGRTPEALRQFLDGVPASIVPCADIHSGQLGSHPGALLRTTTKRIDGPRSGSADLFSLAAKAAWPMVSKSARQTNPGNHHA